MISQHPWWQNAALWTQQIMAAHYTRNLDYVMEWLDEDVMWVGPARHQFITGMQKLEKILMMEQHIPCHISEQQYTILHGDENTCLVSGWLEVHTDESTGLLLNVLQRITFEYALISGIPKVIHMHVSNPWEGMEQNEPFPYRAGRETFLYMQKRIREKTTDPKKIAVRDCRNNSHIIMENEIIYIAADRAKCTIRVLDGRIGVPYRISVLQKYLSERFVQVHRSYIINVDYVVGIAPYTVRLCDGIYIPIPEKRYSQLKADILRHINGIQYVPKV